MRVLYVQFGGQGMGGYSFTRVFSPLPRAKIAKIKEKIMISLMQW
jgi:hypothetical protein